MSNKPDENNILQAAAGHGEQAVAELGEQTAAERGEQAATGRGEQAIAELGEQAMIEHGEQTATERGEQAAVGHGEQAATGRGEQVVNSAAQVAGGAAQAVKKSARVVGGAAKAIRRTARSIRDQALEVIMPGEGAVDNNSENAASNVAAAAAEKTASKTAEKTTSKAAAKTAAIAAAKTAANSAANVMGTVYKAAVKTASKAAVKTASKAAVKTASKATAKTASKATAKTAATAASRYADPYADSNTDPNAAHNTDPNADPYTDPNADPNAAPNADPNTASAELLGTRPSVAYFCMEFGLDSEFKIYSGGLGILAGDLIKAARDIDYPMTAVGILWRQGYTSQTIGANGLPVDAYPEYRYDFLKDTGVTVTVKIKSFDVRCKVWLCDCFSNIPLYLLDAFLPENTQQLVTGQLYGWFEEERLAQEIILGVGGVRALNALGIRPDIYHFNEGHAALAGLELINCEIGDAGIAGAARRIKFQSAWKTVREKIVFTTHTPVIAGNESHGFDAMNYVGADMGFSKNELRQIGGEPFNMTVAGLRLSRASNAVAELHAVTANRMWAHIGNASSIVPITNGVHNGTWQDDGISEAAQAYNSGDGEVRAIAGKYLWSRHADLKAGLIGEIYAREGVRLDPGRLTIGFARRAAPYKRSDLIFSDEERIKPLLDDGRLQIVFSGKAHPNDMTGKQIVSNLVRMAGRYPHSVVFIQNYDMRIGALMTRGCDVWLNNPVRPMEASGTSGMKAAMNGVLNFSVLDGWWPEGCVHGENGWQIGDAYEGEDQDSVDAESLYNVLFNEIIPMYYEDRLKWIDMMAQSTAMSQYKFSAARMFEDYIARLYNG